MDPKKIKKKELERIPSGGETEKVYRDRKTFKCEICEKHDAALEMETTNTFYPRKFFICVKCLSIITNGYEHDVIITPSKKHASTFRDNMERLINSFRNDADLKETW